MNKLKMWLAWKLGYNVVTRLSLEPPEHFTARPDKSISTNSIFTLRWRGRLRILFGGNIQHVNVIWLDDKQNVMGDAPAFVINPPRILNVKLD